MESGGHPGEIAIGRALADARERTGLELADAEQRTKIRSKYLRALEEEHWEELPSTAYAKGFLRTYAALLDLDAELLVDEYRRQVEARGREEGGPLREQVLEHRRRPGHEERRGGPLTAVLALIALASAVVAVITLTGDDDEPAPAGRQAGEGRERKRERRQERPPATGDLIRLELRVRKPVEVCLLGAGGRALIDGQLLSAGSRDAFASERFQLRFPAGFDRDQVVLELNGKRAKLPAIDGPARLRITPPGRVREASPPGESCP